ncbi:MAG: MopE-related protein [Planctomycetota bacterium]|jgi:MYXO-CTERM domain-containing protein
MRGPGATAALLVPLLLSLAPSAAAQDEEPFFFPGTQPGELEVPIDGPGTCLECHAGYEAEVTAAPGDWWLGSMMANSARDPLFLAALTVANQDIDDVGSLCLRCHTPVGWLGGRSMPADGSALLEQDLEGVQCGFCHRLVPGEDRDPPGPLVGEGMYYLADDDILRGPRDDPQSRHFAQGSDFYRDSALCGNCHSVTNPVLPHRAADGTELGGLYPEQRTYEEWAQSAFAVEEIHCQTCHMPRVEGRAAEGEIAPIRPDIAVHSFAGANVWGTMLLQAAYPGERDAAYERARQANLESLQAAASVEISGLPAALDGDAPFGVTVRVTNLTGHKLPTGYPEGRRMWLEVTADIDGEPAFFGSGLYDLMSATLLHDDQLREYRAHPGIAGEGPSFHLVLNDAFFSDTRIPPRGFMPEPALLPVGRDYSDGQGGFRHWDDAPFALPAPGRDAGIVTVTARLLYQTAERDYIEFLRDENVTDQRGQRLYDLWAATGRSAPVEMAVAIARTRLDGTPCGDEACNGVDDDCDGQTDEGFGTISCGTGACVREVNACEGGAPAVCTPGPAGDETCNSIDDDCDGETDEALPDQICGRGDCRVSVAACVDGAPPACVPDDPEPEVCDRRDNDCDGRLDEQIPDLECGLGACYRIERACRRGVPQICQPGQPAEQDTCNAIDDDCDGETDEEIAPEVCGIGACRNEVPGCVDGGPAICLPLEPGEELCNGLDDDCDMAADEGIPAIVCGVGACRRTVDACPGGVPAVCVPGPVADEICNEVDDDCDGVTDEDTCAPDAAVDAAVEPTMDAAVDAGIDAAVDAAMDAEADAAVDAEVDALVVPVSDAARPEPDAAPPMPDAAPPMPDGAPPVPDAALPVPDAALPVPDAAPLRPDAAPPVPDAAAPAPDAAAPAHDAAPPVPDGAPPVPDAASAVDAARLDPDAAPRPSDAAPPATDASTPPADAELADAELTDAELTGADAAGPGTGDASVGADGSAGGGSGDAPDAAGGDTSGEGDSEAGGCACDAGDPGAPAPTTALALLLLLGLRRRRR